MKERIHQAAVFSASGFSAQTIANILGMDISNYYKMLRGRQDWAQLVREAVPLSEEDKIKHLPYFVGGDMRKLRVAYAVARFNEGYSIKEISAALNRAGRTVLIYLKDAGIACGRGVNYTGRDCIPDVPEKLVYRPGEH